MNPPFQTPSRTSQWFSVDTTALVDHVAGGGGLAGVHVADDDNADMELFLSHFCSSLRQILKYYFNKPRAP